MRLLTTILISIIVLFSAWWFHIIFIPLIVLLLLWTRWVYHEKWKYYQDKLRSWSALSANILTGTFILGIGLVAGILLYRFGIELINVPSPSMERAIHAGNYIAVNKLVPGPRRFPEDPEKYFRMKGTGDLQQGDIVLFNFPEGDTILENRHDESYYYLKRHYSNFDRLRKIRKWGNLVPLSVKNRPRFVKRIAALPGDTVTINTGFLYINKKPANLSPTIIKKFRWLDDESSFRRTADKFKIIEHYQHKGYIVAEMTTGTYNQLPLQVKQKFSPALLERNVPDIHTFPFKTSTGWNTDYMGPVKVPAKGDTLTLDSNNYAIYQRAIRVYENNELEIRNNTIFINGKPDNKYIFKFNYYWVMGDNRPHSFDSRFWGFLPENHIVGKIPEKFVNSGIQ